MTTLDQAATLRELMDHAASRRASRAVRQTRVIAVASGKGGVGKTNVTVNLAIALAREGLRVIVLDGDLGLANVDVVLGIVSKVTLADVVDGTARLVDAIVPAPGGFWVIPGASGLEELANLSDERRLQLVEALGELDGHADIVLVDTAAGISAEVSAFLAAADEVIVVTTPEPTAITDAYALIKVASQARRTAGDSPTHFRLVVNQANGVGEANDVARKIATVAREFLDVSLELLGHVPLDPWVGRSVRRQVPLLVGYPSSPASIRIVELARRLASSRPIVRESGFGIIGFLQRLARPRAAVGAQTGVR